MILNTINTKIFAISVVTVAFSQYFVAIYRRAILSVTSHGLTFANTSPLNNLSLHTLNHRYEAP